MISHLFNTAWLLYAFVSARRRGMEMPIAVLLGIVLAVVIAAAIVAFIVMGFGKESKLLEEHLRIPKVE